MKIKYRFPYIIAVFFVIIATNSDAAKTKVKIPPEYTLNAPKKISFFDGVLHVDLYAASFSQGNAVYAEVVPDSGYDLDSVRDIALNFNSYSVRLSVRKWGWRAIFPISPSEVPGKDEVTLSYRSSGKFSITHIPVEIAETKFDYKESSLDLGAFSNVPGKPNPEVSKFIEECQKRKNIAFSSNQPDLLDESLSHPRDLHRITSNFWSKRNYKQYKITKIKKKRKRVYMKSVQNIHRGVDLGGMMGSPVFAVAKGKVVLSGRMFYEGNMIIIDHGNKIFSYYMHMSVLHVKEGDFVNAGDTIGDVGSTGMSTGPHLHFSVMIDSTQVYGLSLLCLPIRD